MEKKYKSEEIGVDTDGTVIVLAGADIYSFSIYPVDGNITVELYTEAGYGNTIKGYSTVPMQEDFGCQKIRIKAVTGTVLVSYFIKGR